jgi:hypothetical protein
VVLLAAGCASATPRVNQARAQLASTAVTALSLRELRG